MNLKNNIEKNIEELTSNLTSEELVLMIKKLTKEYYISYFNGNAEGTKTIAELLNKLASNNDSYNIKCYINYSLLTSINSLITEDNDSDLLAFEVDLTKDISEVTVNLLEKVKQKRQELKELNETGAVNIG